MGIVKMTAFYIIVYYSIFSVIIYWYNMISLLLQLLRSLEYPVSAIKTFTELS